MRDSSLQRSTLSILLLSSLLLCAGAGHASPDQSPSSESGAARGAVRRLLQLGERAESQRGGEIALARRRAETNDAQRTAAWLDWLPDFSFAARRQVEQVTDAELNVPRWRFDLEAQLALTVPKLRAVDIANSAREKGRAELEEAAHTARRRTLEASVELYLIERRTALLEEQIGTLAALASTIIPTPDGGSNDDRVLVDGYLGELRGTLAELEYRRREAAQRLAATVGVPLTSSGLDPRLELPSLLEVIRTEFDASSARAGRVRQADVELEEQRERWTQSQSWYVPELRSTTLALLPQGNGLDAQGTSFRLTSVTTEISLGWRLRPGVPALQAAQRRAITKSRFDQEQSRFARGLTEDQTRARLDEFSRSWQDDGSVRLARSEFRDAMQRFARGERTVAELSSASRSLLQADLRREDLLGEALRAQVALSSNDRADLAPPGKAHRQELSSPEVDRGLLGSVERAPALRGARAEAERATQRARSERFWVATGIDAGVLLPVYESGDLDLPVRPELSLSGSGSLATVVREASVLGRWSLDLRPTAATQHAFESEARLRQAQVELQRKKYQWRELEARLELAHARKAFELATRASQGALESWQRETQWFEQGAASERDVRLAELAHHSARDEQGKVEARLRSAEVLMASYLGAERGRQVSVNESPEAVESWALHHFLPENQLIGFESAERRREALLEATLAHAQTEALAKPARGTTLTTQVIQGVRGGAFSFTLALSVALDSVRDAPQLTRAAEREGRARGHMNSIEREFEEQRALLRQRLDEADELLETEAAIQQRLTTLGDTLRREQAARPDVHPAVRQRQLDALQAAILDSERRRADAEEQRRTAMLRAVALGNPLKSTLRPPSVGSSLEAAESALVQLDPEVAAADAAAISTRERQPVPVASALHPVGPFAIGSYSANRVVGPTTTKTWRGDFGVGLALGLDESLSFLATSKLSNAAEHERVAARQASALRAMHELGRTWTARELSRLSKEEETEARRQLDGSVQPRYELGQVTAATLLEAQQRHAFARLRRASDESLVRTQHALLVALGGAVSDAGLDEYQKRASTWATQHAGGEQATRASDSDPAQLAAEERSAAAASVSTASALRFVSPITALAEVRPARFETTTGTDEARESSAGHELLWVFSLIVPVKLKEFGALSVASARARESDDELAAAARAAQLRKLGLRARLAALQKEKASAATRRMAAEHALAELDGRLRAAQDHATIDDVAAARASLFEARRAEVLVDGAILEAASLLEATKENR